MSEQTITINTAEFEVFVEKILGSAKNEILEWLQSKSKTSSKKSKKSKKTESSSESTEADSSTSSSISEEELKSSKKSAKSSKKMSESDDDVPNPSSLTDISKLNKSQVIAYCKHHNIKVKGKGGKNPTVPIYKAAAAEFFKSQNSPAKRGRKKSDSKGKSQKTSSKKTSSKKTSEKVTKESIKKMVGSELKKLAKEKNIKLKTGMKNGEIKEVLISNLVGGESSSSQEDASSSSSSEVKPKEMKGEWNKDLRVFTVSIEGSEYLIDPDTKSLVATIAEKDGEYKIIKMKAAEARNLDKKGYPLWNVVFNKSSVGRTATLKEIEEVIEHMREKVGGEFSSSSSSEKSEAESSASSGSSSSSSSEEGEKKPSESEKNTSSSSAEEEEEPASEMSSSSGSSDVSSSSTEEEEEDLIASEVKDRIKVTERDFEKFYRAIEIEKVGNDVNDIRKHTRLPSEVIQEIKDRYARFAEDYANVIAKIKMETKVQTRTKQRRPKFTRRK